MFTILFKSHVHFWTHCSISCCNRISWLLRKFCQICLRILLKSRLKSSTTSSDAECLPRDFSLLTLPARTNLLITCLMCTSNDVSWIVRSRYLARYSCLQPITEYTYTSFTKSHCDNKTQQWKCLVQQKKLFSQSSLPSTKTQFLYATTKSFENDCFVVLTLDQRDLL